jgi:hypothetical protein
MNCVYCKKPIKSFNKHKKRCDECMIKYPYVASPKGSPPFVRPRSKDVKE